jgi:hypothetical protein
MASGNQVVLTFGANTQPAEDGFRRVGKASDEIKTKVGESEDSFGHAGEAAEESQKKAQGFADVLGGATDVGSGFGSIMKGDVVGGLAGVGQGLAGIADGTANFLIPALGKAKTAILGMNLEFLASPITWIIVGIGLIIAAIVLIATKTDWFQKAWKVIWGGIKDAAEAVGKWFKDTLWDKWIKGAWSAIQTAGESVWNWLKNLPKNIGSAFSSIAKIISAPFRSAFNFVADAWNNTIGRLSWSVPGWVPVIGGDSISVPQLPHFHTGGVVPGAAGSEMLAVLQAGERVIPAGGSSNETAHVSVVIDGHVLVEAVSQIVRRRGGNVQTTLGGRNA